MATRGRAPRKPQGPKKGGKKVKSHRRSPRGRNSGKPGVTVRPYKRRNPWNKRKRGRR